MALGIKFGSPTDLTLTGLGGLAAGNMWQSGKLDVSEVSSGIQVFGVNVWFEIELSNTPTNGNRLIFRIAEGSEATTEVWPARLGETIGAITDAAAKQRVRASMPSVHQSPWQTNMATTDPRLAGYFSVLLGSPDWQLIVDTEFGIDASPSAAHLIQVRYFHYDG